MKRPFYFSGGVETINLACSNCGTDDLLKGWSGRCALCANYFWRTKRERPEKLWSKDDKCSNCKAEGIHAMKKCNTCYNYWVKYKRDRPKRLWMKSTHCQNPNCGILLQKKRNRTGDLCGACYSYNGRTGLDRPKEYCLAPGSIGWCKCGNPAYHKSLTLESKDDNGELIFSTRFLCEGCKVEDS